ncbi:unnamed protein product, partial [Didymodactylos carnosus]
KPPLPTPSIRYTDETIDIMLDWSIVVSTTSAEDAVALWISLYDIFEIKFGQHSVPTRLLFSMIFNDKTEASKATRKILNDWEIKIDLNVPTVSTILKEEDNTPPSTITESIQKSEEDDSAVLLPGTTNNVKDQLPPPPPLQVENSKRKSSEIDENDVENNHVEDNQPKNKSTVTKKLRTNTSNETAREKTKAISSPQPQRATRRGTRQFL